MTNMEIFESRFAELEESKDFDQVLCYAKELAMHIVELNALGRAGDRARDKLLDKDTNAKLYRLTFEEKLKGDEFTKEEYEFYAKLFENEDE